jgi:hypothetical protein
MILEFMRLRRWVKKIPFPIGGIGHITSWQNENMTIPKGGALTAKPPMSM